MTAFLGALEKMSAATTPAEYLIAQRACVECGSAEEALEIARSSEPNSARRCDCLQVAYWITPVEDRVDRFRRLFEEAGSEDKEFLKALLFRALTEKTVRESHPERLERYIASVQEEFAKSLFAA